MKEKTIRTIKTVKRTPSAHQVAETSQWKPPLDTPLFRVSATLSFAMGLCIMYYAWMASTAMGDFQGDSWEYLNIAAAMRAGTFRLVQYNYLRGLIYPWLLSVSWGHSGALTYFIQGGLFVTSLFVAMRSLSFGSIYSLLPWSIATIPSFAFLQKLVYPDGLLVSLSLLFFVSLARKRWILCTLLGILLVLTKVIFGIALVLELIVFASQMPFLRSKWLNRIMLGALAVAPFLVYLLFCYVFVDLGYMVTYSRPYSNGYTLDRLFPDSELLITCGNREHAIAKKDLFFDPITTPYAVSPFGPLRESQVKSLGCSSNDLRILKRHLITQALRRDPSIQIVLWTKTFARSLIGSYEIGHVAYMLESRKRSWIEHLNNSSYLAPYEIVLLKEYQKIGIEIPLNPAPLLRLNELAVDCGQRWFGGALAVALGICLGFAYRRGVLSQCARDLANRGLTLFLVLYSFTLASSIPRIYDRYSYVNLILLSFLTARVAAMTFSHREHQQR